MKTKHKRVRILVLSILLFVSRSYAFENTDTLAPPPINFEQEFVRVDGRVYEVSFKNNRLSIQADPPWYREAIHNYVKRLYGNDHEMSQTHRFSWIETKKIYFKGVALKVGEIVFKVSFYGFLLFSAVYVQWMLIIFIYRLLVS